MMAGHVRVFRADHPYGNIIVGAPDIADVNVMSDRRFIVTAKKTGMTTLLLTAEDGATMESMDVHVVASVAYLKEPIRVRSIGREPADVMYWCGAETGCDPDPGNTPPVSESTTVLTLPGGGQAVTRTTTPILPQRQ
jgi:hypothetical protein